MEKEFDFTAWDNVKDKLKNIFPQLTEADLRWRHETGNELFATIATKLGKTRKEFNAIIDSFDINQNTHWQNTL